MIIQKLYNANIADNNRNISVSLNDVMKSFATVEKSLYRLKTCKKTDLDKAVALTESYIKINNKIFENNSLKRKLRLLVESYNILSNSKINEWMQAGFDTFNDFQSELPDNPELHGQVKIKKVLPWCSNSSNKIFYKDGRIFAGKRYSANDIIEEAPMRIIHVEDTYSRPIRDLTFEVDGENGIYAIPFGYAIYYRIDENSPKASYDFVYEPKTGTGYVVIRALKPIMKGDEITIIKDSNKFSNKLYDRFTAANGLVQDVPIKNFRFN